MPEGCRARRSWGFSGSVCELTIVLVLFFPRSILTTTWDGLWWRHGVGEGAGSFDRRRGRRAARRVHADIARRRQPLHGVPEPEQEGCRRHAGGGGEPLV